MRTIIITPWKVDENYNHYTKEVCENYDHYSMETWRKNNNQYTMEACENYNHYIVHHEIWWDL